MARSQLDKVLGRVRNLLAAHRAGSVPDRGLLDDFIARRDEAAFAALVHRHGAMVLSVCRRTLNHAADAEDACQATFLVLANKAASIRKRDALGSWLHGVAFRVARKLRADRARRTRGKTSLVDVADVDTTAEVTWREVQAVLDEELARLPDSYRAPLVLCYLEGKTQDEAARELGWSTGTLRGRLGRGRERLRGRLVRRGLTLSAALFGAILGETTAFGTVSVTLETSLVRAALAGVSDGAVAAGVVSAEVAALTQGVIKAMFLTKVRTAALVLLVTLITAGGGLLTYRAAIEASAATAAVPEVPAKPASQEKPRPAPAANPAAPADQGAQPRPASVDDKTIRDLITQLGSEEFDTRNGAYKRLEAIGEPALKLLRKAGQENTDAEVRQTARALVKAIEKTLFGEERSFKGHGQGGIGGDLGTWVTRVAITPDGKHAVSAGFDALRLWDLKTGAQVRVFGESTQGYWALAFSKDGKRLIAANGGARAAPVFDVNTGRLLKKLAGHTAEVWGAALTADGKTAVTGAWDQSIRVWDVDAGKETRQFKDVSGHVRCLALSPNGKLVAAGHFAQLNGPGTVRLWDMDTGKEIKALEGNAQEVSSVGFSSDSKTIVSSGFDKTIRLWDVKTGKELKCLKGHSQRVEYATFTPDDKRVVSCGNDLDMTLRLWDVASGQQLYQSEPVMKGFVSVAVLPDSHHCVTTGKDGLVRLWRWKK
jgi:RNA polymerase sigma factor (sigma-70 family)